MRATDTGATKAREVFTEDGGMLRTSKALRLGIHPRTLYALRDAEPEPGLADNGDLEVDLATLLEQVGSAAKAADTAVVLFIDELQYVEEPQMAALISAIHRCAQERLPVTIVGAGLPQLRGRMGDA